MSKLSLDKPKNKNWNKKTLVQSQGFESGCCCTGESRDLGQLQLDVLQRSHFLEVVDNLQYVQVDVMGSTAIDVHAGSFWNFS
jgi:adenylosuccinate synthase